MEKQKLVVLIHGHSVEENLSNIKYRRRWLHNQYLCQLVYYRPDMRAGLGIAVFHSLTGEVCAVLPSVYRHLCRSHL